MRRRPVAEPARGPRVRGRRVAARGSPPLHLGLHVDARRALAPLRSARPVRARGDRALNLAHRHLQAVAEPVDARGVVSQRGAAREAGLPVHGRAAVAAPRRPRVARLGRERPLPYRGAVERRGRGGVHGAEPAGEQAVLETRPSRREGRDREARRQVGRSAPGGEAAGGPRVLGGGEAESVQRRVRDVAAVRLSHARDSVQAERVHVRLAQLQPPLGRTSTPVCVVLVLSEASLAAARRERGLVRSDGALRRRRGQVDPLAVGAAAGWGRGALQRGRPPRAAERRGGDGGRRDCSQQAAACLCRRGGLCRLGLLLLLRDEGAHRPLHARERADAAGAVRRGAAAAGVLREGAEDLGVRTEDKRGQRRVVGVVVLASAVAGAVEVVL
mmetsp:Transcript_25341/g.80317  ORF Transcript_25341/g.80317 Transcript_25341/m.80317 type:complete len:387 (+) Transcript_25341:826-1986(+)